VSCRHCRYGIGQVYLRQEKWGEAHHHFRAAAAINKRSSVLHCYTGMALHRQGLHAEALQCLQVCRNPPKNPYCPAEAAVPVVRVRMYQGCGLALVLAACMLRFAGERTPCIGCLRRAFECSCANSRRTRSR
jgi:hypothetical protein